LVKNSSGGTVSVPQSVKRKTFPKAEVESLFNDLKKKRKDILRFTKGATVYVNMLVEKTIEDFISSCQPLQQGKKSQEKTLGWKQFNNEEFKQKFTYSLVTNSDYFTTFLHLKSNIRNFNTQKELKRLRCNATKADTPTVYQDLQKYKQLMSNSGKLSNEDLKKLVVSEFDEEWTEQLASVYNTHLGLQAEDDQSKFLFNSVKIVTKQTKGDDDAVKSKISNGFKNLVSKVIRQVLMTLASKIEIYLTNCANH